MSAVCVPSGVAKNLITGLVEEIISDEFTFIFFLSKSCFLKILLVVRLSHIFPTATCPVEFALSLFLKCKVPLYLSPSPHRQEKELPCCICTCSKDVTKRCFCIYHLPITPRWSSRCSEHSQWQCGHSWKITW